MSAAYASYYKAKLESALLYQDFVTDMLYQAGLVVQQYASKAYQQKIGETKTGIEIKHDEKLAKTGNLWIEVSEKARPREGDYFPSGICRADNAWLYAIGNYNVIYVFQKSILLALYRAGRYKIRENNTMTSEGFLMPEEDARKYAGLILSPNAAQKVSKLCLDLAEIGRSLHQLVKTNPAQHSLFSLEGSEPDIALSRNT